MTLAVIDNTSTVIALVDFSGFVWTPPAGTTTVDAPAGTTVGSNYANGVFTPPAPPPAPPLSLTFPQFMALFTPTEQAGLVSSNDVQTKLFILQASNAQAIQLSNALVIQGVNYVASIGIITTDRAAQILAGTPPA